MPPLVSGAKVRISDLDVCFNVQPRDTPIKTTGVTLKIVFPESFSIPE